MKILKNIGLLVLSIVISYLLNSKFYLFYKLIYGTDSGGLFYVYQKVAEYFVAFLFAYLFFIFLLFTAFGDRHKYWWAGLAALPAAVFLIYFDFSHIYFHAIFPVVGWFFGTGINRLRAHWHKI